MANQRELLLVTGSAGYAAGLMLPNLRRHYRLRLLDVKDQWPVDDDEIVRVDVCDTPALIEACRGVRGVVHLAAHPSEGDFLGELVPNNLVATWSLFQATAEAGVGHVVFASTLQTMTGGGREAGSRSADAPPRPRSIYAASKLFGEALARYHADRNELKVACLRLGWLVPSDSPLFRDQPSLPGLWCGPQDLVDLVLAALGSEVPFATVIAVSPPATKRFDTTNPFGWVPRERPGLQLRWSRAITAPVRRAQARLQRA